MAGPSAQDVDFTTDKMAVNMAAGNPAFNYKQIHRAALSWLVWDTVIHFDVEQHPANEEKSRSSLPSVYVLFNQNKFILGAMITLFIGEIAMMITVLAIVLPRMSFGTDCLVAAAPSFFMAYW
ncbi:hypothetical protein PHLCEN_2v8483 [Hermanssonia centrifuga]|uniref:Uncharacterized protein n=1 Tax=Hermanssonia centrifuga TaxID=98765 RepID=A0A2R6NTJ0_9APHY|nr:hypothetical protein PHLCEN_2v8483 [Hermanssonia centrifuga]